MPRRGAALSGRCSDGVLAQQRKRGVAVQLVLLTATAKRIMNKALERQVVENAEARGQRATVVGGGRVRCKGIKQ